MKRPSNNHSRPCTCKVRRHDTCLVAVTGGPGAGKTAVVEMASRAFCEHVATCAEAASIVFGGGFPRGPTESGRRASQRAIYYVQLELERLVLDDASVALSVCDRGTLDGLAYWPGSDEDFFASLGTSREAEIARYAAVIHLRTPTVEQGYDHSNRLRVESAEDAAAIDARLEAAWSAHPNRHVISCADDFIEKALAALDAIRESIPECCGRHDHVASGA